MKLTVPTAELANVLKQVCRVANRNAADIHGHVLLDVSPSAIAISAHNGKQQITLTIEGPFLDVEATGMICVQAAKLDQVITSLPKDKPVSIALKDEKLSISCGRSKFNLAVLPADNFPSVTFPHAEVCGSLNLAGSVLSAALRQVGFCAARNDVRYFLNGVLFDLEPGVLTLVATDGHRLGVTEVATHCAVQGKFILPSTCTEDVAAFCGAGDVEVAFSKNMVRYTTKVGVLFSRLVDGAFPQYKGHVESASQGHIARVGRTEIASAVSRVTLMSDSKIAAVKLSVGADSISIQSISTDVQNEANDVLPCDYEAEPFEIGLNGVITAELLRALGSEDVDLYFNGPDSATLLRDRNSPSHSFVLMPVRL